jgi:hypothetical protein
MSWQNNSVLLTKTDLVGGNRLAVNLIACESRREFCFRSSRAGFDFLSLLPETFFSCRSSGARGYRQNPGDPVTGVETEFPRFLLKANS